MKRTLSLLLILTLLLSLFALSACSNSGDDTTSAPPVSSAPEPSTPSEEELTTERLKKSLPKEYVPEKLAAGMEVTVAISIFDTSETQQRMMFDGMTADMEEAGFKVISADSGGDQITQINQLENFIEMKPALIVCWLSDVDSYREPCKKAMDAGIFFYLQGSWADYEPSGQEFMDQYKYGLILGEATIAWLDYRYPDAEPGSINTAFFCTTFNIDNNNTIRGIEEVWATEPRINVVYKNEDVMLLDEGFSAAEDAFTLDSTIKLVQTITPLAAIGANNYIIANSNLVLEDIGICMRGDNPQTQELLAAGATNDGSVFRSKGGAGGNYFWESAYNICMGLLMGDFEEPYVYDARFYIDTNFGYSYDSRPAA